MAYGLASFLVANAATFVVATQVYGDIFVLFLIGTTLAALMALPILSERALYQPFGQRASSRRLVARPT
jgi:hypothetical protein